MFPLKVCRLRNQSNASRPGWQLDSDLADGSISCVALKYLLSAESDRCVGVGWGRLLSCTSSCIVSPLTVTWKWAKSLVTLHGSGTAPTTALTSGSSIQTNLQHRTDHRTNQLASQIKGAGGTRPRSHYSELLWKNHRRSSELKGVFTLKKKIRTSLKAFYLNSRKVKWEALLASF